MQLSGSVKEHEREEVGAQRSGSANKMECNGAEVRKKRDCIVGGVQRNWSSLELELKGAEAHRKWNAKKLEHKGAGV